MSCKTILIVEDEKDIRDTYALALEIEGYTVVCAANGKDGLDLLPRTQGPCLILLDLMMPVMNGWEFLKAMRKNDVLAVIPVVVVSAFGELAKCENIENILKKPIELDTLLNIVKKYCG